MNPPSPDLRPAKNQPFAARLGFAWRGIATVARREKSFRAQAALAVAAAAGAAALRLSLAWLALIVLASALVLALEAVNGALEYLIDHLHPSHAAEIGRAKDAAAGAVLIASLGAATVGALALISAV